jgi:outer membrane receptor protein involved in Fe transport
MKHYLLLILSSLSFCTTLFAAESPPTALDSNGTYVLPQILITHQNKTDTSQKTKISGGDNTSVITQQAIATSGAENITQVLSQNASVQTYSQTGANPVFYLRGQRATILLNGQPISQFDSSGQNISFIPMSDVEKIEINNNSSSVLYGSMGIGGTINIITKNASKMQNQISISPSYPTYGQASASFHKDLGSDWVLGFSNTSQNQSGYRDYSRTINSATQLSLSKKYETGKLTINLNNGYQNLQFPGALTNTDEQQNPWQATSGKQDYETYTAQLGIDWQQEINENLDFSNYAVYRQMWANGDYPDPKSGLPAFTQNAQLWSTRPALKIYSKFYGRALSTIIGADLSHQTFSQSTTIHHAEQNNIEPFVQSKLQLNKQWSFGGGARFAYISTNGSFTPSLAPPVSNNDVYTTYALSSFLQYRWTRAFTTAFEVSRAYQLPFIDQSSLTGQGTTTTTFGLKPQTSISYSLNNSYNTKSLSLGLDLYFMNTENQIYFDSTAVQHNKGANVNLDPTRQFGAIINANYQLFTRLSLGGSTSLLYNTFRSGSLDGKQVPGQPNLQAETHFTLKLTERLDWYLQEQYHGTQYPDSDLKNAGAKVAPYWLTNTALNYHLNNWRIQLRINNLFNKYYYDYVTGYSAGNAFKYSYYPADGINGHLSLTYTFL